MNYWSRGPSCFVYKYAQEEYLLFSIYSIKITALIVWDVIRDEK